MDYETGLHRLKSMISKEGNREAIQAVDTLEEQLRGILRRQRLNPEDTNLQAELDRTLNELNKIASREVGASFTQLCNTPKPIFSVTLTHLLGLILVFIFVPGLGVSLGNLMVDITTQERIDRIQDTIQAIDARINAGVTSPFYKRLLEPCSPAVQKVIAVQSSLSVRFVSSGVPSYCIWEYVEVGSDSVIARDLWETGYQISVREYYSGGVLIARDTFKGVDNARQKEREFYDTQGNVFLLEHFTESGVGLDKKWRTTGKEFWPRRQRLRSPFPPMFFWFMYR